MLRCLSEANSFACRASCTAAHARTSQARLFGFNCFRRARPGEQHLLANVLSIRILQISPFGHSGNHRPIHVQKISPCLTIRRIFHPRNQAFTGFRNIRQSVSLTVSHRGILVLSPFRNFCLNFAGCQKMKPDHHFFYCQTRHAHSMAVFMNRRVIVAAGTR